MSTFILVHGAWHGGWCWQRLALELEARGHRSVVMDLPVEDGDATFEDYAEAVLASYPANLEDGVLVGHSLGAMVLPLVAASRPPSLVVFLCGLIPNLDGKPWHDAPPMGRPRRTKRKRWPTGQASFRHWSPHKPLFMPIAASRMRDGPSSGCARKTRAASGIVHTRCGDFRRFPAQPSLLWTTRPSLLSSAVQSPSRDLVSTPSRSLVPTRPFLPVRASSPICSTS